MKTRKHRTMKRCSSIKRRSSRKIRSSRKRRLSKKNGGNKQLEEERIFVAPYKENNSYKSLSEYLEYDSPDDPNRSKMAKAWTNFFKLKKPVNDFRINKA